MKLLVAWLRALLFTQIVEAPIYRRMLDVSLWKALVPTFVTHPFVWFVFPRLARLGLSYVQWATLAEVSVSLVEATILARLAHVPWRRGAWVAFVGNAASLVLGLAVTRVFGGI